MKEHKKIERLLNLLKLLSSNIGYNYQQLSDRIGVTERTIRRYLKSCEEAGLFLENNNGYFRFEKNSPYTKDIGALLHFSDEEAILLYESINSIERDTQTKINLRNKLYSLYNSDRVSYPVINSQDSSLVRKLINAIREKRQVEIVNYRSSSSASVSSRIIEPYDFTTNYIHVWAFESKYKKNYIFRVSRIEDVRITEKPWEFEKLHKKHETDVFRMAGDKKLSVELELTLTAYNHLIEYYPLAREHIIKKADSKYIFSHWYTNVKGISKFILSVMNDVKIISPRELALYLNETIKNKKF